MNNPELRAGLESIEHRIERAAENLGTLESVQFRLFWHRSWLDREMDELRAELRVLRVCRDLWYRIIEAASKP